MNLPHFINTIDERIEITFTEKKSNFIAQVYSVQNEADVKSYLSEIKKKYYNASHHCYAYKFADGTFHYSDAGEPSGTAGIRILNAMDHFGLRNQMVVVSRYFGGTKLGVGQLGKTYYNAAYQVLDKSTVNEKHLFQKVNISVGFDQISNVHRILSGQQSIIRNTEYSEHVKFSCFIKPDELNEILRKLTEVSQNQFIFEKLEEFVYQ
jgi:uncharacterized YigZ family protein